MQNYYRVLIEVGKKKYEKHDRIVYIRTSTNKPIDEVLLVVRKIKAAKLLIAKKIDREAYIAGVSAADY
jgi:hypothetical protein